MKIFTLIILAAIVSISAYSQDFVSGDLDKKFYLRGGLSTPTWTYYGFKNANILKDTLGAESRTGANFEIGAIFMLNGIDVGPGLRFGINVDFLSLKSQIFRLQGGDNIYNFFIGSKIGPSFSYGLTKAITFDVFAKINPVWAGAVYKNHQDFDNGVDVYYSYTQLMYSFGLNVRISVLIVGFEYEIGGLKLKNQNGDYWPNYSDVKNKRTPMSGFNVTVGLNF